MSELEMSPAEAKAIIYALTRGADPDTGEVFAYPSFFDKAKVMQALVIALDALEQMGKRVDTRKISKANVGKSWKQEEDQQLIAEFESNSALKTIAASHQRTRGAIQARLVKLGLIEYKNEAK